MISAPTTTLTDKVVDYWQIGDTDAAFDFDTAITEDLALKAIWTDVTYTVSFDTDGGNDVYSQEVVINGQATEPDNPTKSGFIFSYWYLGDDQVAYDFSTAITDDVTLTAYWLTDSDILAMINEDALDVETNLLSTPYDLNIPKTGRINESRILWVSPSDHIAKSGVVIPLGRDAEDESATITVIYSLHGMTVNKSYEIDLPHESEVVLVESRTLNFYNTTTEYDVEDATLTLYYEMDGSVPYVKVTDFFALLEGFIDPELMPSANTEDGILTLAYQYYDEEEDYTYDLTCVIDTNTNTITTPDPGFYWAYVYSTETNYGRHIVYDNDNPNEYYSEGIDVYYDLNAYNMDMSLHEGDVVLPYYLVNQLFAGSSYYNVYYNYDALYGIYALPNTESESYISMKTSSMNNATIPSDLLVHTYHMFAFNLDYFYGLQEMMEVNTYYDVIVDYMDDLLSKSAVAVDEGITDVLVTAIDEPHTSYGYP